MRLSAHRGDHDSPHLLQVLCLQLTSAHPPCLVLESVHAIMFGSDIPS